VSSVINTNVSSLNAQRNMLKSSGELSNSMQRLSTGLRINSAKDDAAGLAISSRMTGQIRGMNQAVRNANDGISFVQTAEGALSTITNNLQRVRELAVQSTNSSNTQTDRDALNTEAQSLLQEIDRVAGQTQFNGQNLTDGSFSSGIFQVGSNAGQSITIGNLTDARTKSLGEVDVYSKSSATIVTDEGDSPTLEGPLDAIDAGELTIKDSNGNEFALGAIAKASTGQERIGQVVEAINNASAATGVHAYYDSVDPADPTKTLKTITLTSDKKFETTGFDAGTTGVEEFALADTDKVTSDALDKLNISSYADADLAIRQVDEALKRINSDRAAMGALQSRFESAVTNLESSSENLSAARSRIQDTDFASETANMTRAQILQQAGVAMLSQANSAPQTVLSLLKG
jgi:flagellin